MQRVLWAPRGSEPDCACRKGREQRAFARARPCMHNLSLTLRRLGRLRRPSDALSLVRVQEALDRRLDSFKRVRACISTVGGADWARIGSPRRRTEPDLRAGGAPAAARVCTLTLGGADWAQRGGPGDAPLPQVPAGERREGNEGHG